MRMVMQGGRRRVWVLVAAVLGVLLTARLGVWQLDRAEQKTTLQARIDGRAGQPALAQAELARSELEAQGQHYRLVRLRGRWLAQHTVYLDNRQMNGKPGFFVVTPLLLGPGDAVLVQRGWMPRNFQDRTALQPLPTPTGEIVLTGRLAPPPAKLLSLGDTDAGRIRQNLDLLQFAQDIGVALRPLSVQQLAPASLPTDPTPADAAPASALPLADDGLLRQWPAVAVDVGKHHGYALQWFALCALIAGLYLWFQILRPRHA